MSIGKLQLLQIFAHHFIQNFKAMKRTEKMIICLMIYFLGGITLSAQPTKGSWLVGGTVSISASRTEPESQSKSRAFFSIDFQPVVGKAISEKWIVGLGLTTAYTRSTSESSKQKNINTFNTYGVRPFTRYYKTLVSDRIGLFVELGGRFNRGTSKRDIEFDGVATINGQEESVIQAGGDVTPGIFFFATSALAIEAQFGGLNYLYQNRSYEGGLDESSSSLDLDLGASLGLQLTYFFGTN